MNRSIRLIRHHVGGQRSVLTIAALSTVLLAAAELARPFPLKIVIDHLLSGNTGPFSLDGDDLVLLAGVVALLLLISAVEAVAAYQMEIRLRRTGENVSHSLRVAVYGHLQRLSLLFHEGRQQGDLVTRATGDVQQVGLLFSESVGTLASSVLLLLGMIVVSFLIDPVLGLAAFAISPFLAVLTFFNRRRLKVAAKQQRAKEGEIAALATEALSAMRAVKALGSEDYERDRLARASEERQEAGLVAARLESLFAGVVDVTGAVSVAVVLVVGVFRVAAGAVSAGDLIVMTHYARRIHRPLRDLARETGRIARALVRADRVAEILASDEVLTERGAAHHGPRAHGDVEIDGVTFAYSPDRPVLDTVSLRVPAGQKVALSGPSGAGKSTVAGLLARFFDPVEGRVLLDGHDLRDCSLSWLRGQVGLVLQDTILFTGTVAENIAYGTTAGREEVTRAARAAGAHEFIAELPNAYDTMLGPRGVALSGGQRQRIAIARTLLRDPPVLVLDEPTAALDVKSEAEVIAGIETLMAGRTTVIISHSPALVRWADRVVTMEAGRVVSDRSATPDTQLPPEEPAVPVVAATTPVLPPTRPADARTPVPADPALPHMARVLDPAAMSEVLERALGGEAEPPDIAIRYLRYKPRTNLVVYYDVGLDGRRHGATAMITSSDAAERRAAKPENLALAALVDGRAPSPRPLHYDPDARCLVQWLPLDILLPGLAEPPDRVRRQLWSAGIPIAASGEEPTLLAYKPRRRAVLRLDQYVLKVYAEDAAFTAARDALRASGRLQTVVAPRFEGSLPALRLTAQSWLPGEVVAQPAAALAGELLAALHGSGRRMAFDGLPSAGPDAQLAGAAASARLVAEIAPHLKARVERVLGDLEDARPSDLPLVPSHGDFNARQLLVAAGRLLVTDFDEFCLAPRALDPATYVAYLVLGHPDDLVDARRVLEPLIEGYGSRPPAFGWYLATMIMRRAPRPFRYFEPGWPELVAGMVDAAEEASTW